MRYVPGSYSVSDVMLYSEISREYINLAALSTVVEINLYSNVMDDTISGNILIQDSLNLSGNIPIVGSELLILSLAIPESHSEENVIRREFKIEEISKVDRFSEGTMNYILEFSSPEIFKSNQSAIKTSFRKLPISEIASRVYSSLDSPKKINVEQTDNLHDFVIPNWTVFRTLNWLTTKAVSSQREGANYLFYEDFDGYNFKSLETLFDSDVYRTYHQGHSASGTIDDIGTEDFNIIYDFNVKKTFNILQNQVSGMYSSKLVTHSLLDRKVENYKFNYGDSYNKYVHVERNKKNPGGITMLIPPSELTSDGLNYLEDNDANTYLLPSSTQFKPERLLQIRKSQLQQLNGITVEIVILGDTVIRLGNIVELDIPSPQPIGADGDRFIVEPYFSGRYIVSAIKHTLGERHYTTLSLRKDSLFTPLTDGKLETKF